MPADEQPPAALPSLPVGPPTQSSAPPRGREPARRRGSGVWRAFSLLGALAVLGLAVAGAGVGIVLVAAHRTPPPPPLTAQTAATSQPALALAAELAVERRPQTAADRSYAAALRRALTGPARRHGRHRGRRRPRPAPLPTRLRNAIPALIRLVRTMGGGRRAYLVLFYPGKGIRPSYSAGLVLLAPDLGPSSTQQPVVVGTAKTVGQLTDRTVDCFAHTDYALLPDGVASGRLVFDRQDANGVVYPGAVTVHARVIDDAAMFTVTARPPCEPASAVTWYAADGRVVASYGSTAHVNRIRRARPRRRRARRLRRRPARRARR